MLAGWAPMRPAPRRRPPVLLLPIPERPRPLQAPATQFDGMCHELPSRIVGPLAGRSPCGRCREIMVPCAAVATVPNNEAQDRGLQSSHPRPVVREKQLLHGRRTSPHRECISAEFQRSCVG